VLRHGLIFGFELFWEHSFRLFAAATCALPTLEHRPRMFRVDAAESASKLASTMRGRRLDSTSLAIRAEESGRLLAFGAGMP
jgi:hypothetical protein